MPNMTIYVTKETEALLKRYAKGDNKSMSGLINYLVSQNFPRDYVWGDEK